MSAQTGRMRRSLWQGRGPMWPSPARWEAGAAGPPLQPGGRSRPPPPLSTCATSPTPPLVAIPVNTNQAPTLPFTSMSQVSSGVSLPAYPFTDPSPHGLKAGAKIFTAYQVLVDNPYFAQCLRDPLCFRSANDWCCLADRQLRTSESATSSRPHLQLPARWRLPACHSWLFCRRTCTSPSTLTWASFPRRHPPTTAGSTLAPSRGKGGLRSRWCRCMSHVSFTQSSFHLWFTHCWIWVKLQKKTSIPAGVSERGQHFSCADVNLRIKAGFWGGLNTKVVRTACYSSIVKQFGHIAAAVRSFVFTKRAHQCPMYEYLSITLLLWSRQLKGYIKAPTNQSKRIYFKFQIFRIYVSYIFWWSGQMMIYCKFSNTTNHFPTQMCQVSVLLWSLTPAPFATPAPSHPPGFLFETFENEPNFKNALLSSWLSLLHLLASRAPLTPLAPLACLARIFHINHLFHLSSHAHHTLTSLIEVNQYDRSYKIYICVFREVIKIDIFNGP